MAKRKEFPDGVVEAALIKCRRHFNGERFRELEAQGRKRIAHHISELRESLRVLEAEGAVIEERVEARIQELTRTRADAVRESIEKSILDLRQRMKRLEEKQTFVLAAIRQTDSILQSQEDQFTAYGQRIQKVLDQTGESLKLGIYGLISRLLLMDSEMKLALSGMHLKEPVRVVFSVAPPDHVELATGRLTVESPPLIEYMIRLQCRKAPKPAIVAVHWSNSSFDEDAAEVAGL